MINSSLTPNEPNVKTSIRYNRSDRTWEAVNGQVTPTGNGPNGKRNALLLALATDHPRLAQIAGDIARTNGNGHTLVDRLINACRLITHGKIFANGIVESQTREKVYHRTRHDGCPQKYYCSCEDFAYQAPRLPDFGQKMCKHILALHIAYLAGIDLPSSEPVPFNGEPTVYNGKPQNILTHEVQL